MLNTKVRRIKNHQSQDILKTLERFYNQISYLKNLMNGKNSWQ